MKSPYPYLFITTVTLFILSCGVLLPPAVVSETQAVFTQTAQKVHTATHIYTTTPEMLVVLGGDDVTWNIRTGPSLDYHVVGIARGGMVFDELSRRDGWIETDAGWICGGAFGLADRCD